MFVRALMKPRFLPALVATPIVLVIGTVREDDKPVSYFNDIRPLLASNCNACHKPDKSKGDLDMTTHAALMKGGKDGHTVVAGYPAKSKLIEMMSGSEPEMPEDEDPLKSEQVALIERWIKEGAIDDTP